MARDVKDVIGVLMRVIDGGEVSQGELADLGFDAEGEVQAILNEAYIRLLEFAHDRTARETTTLRLPAPCVQAWSNVSPSSSARATGRIE